jgi:hypothetical protein
MRFMMPASVAEYWRLTSRVVPGTLPLAGLCLTLTPASASASVNSRAAHVAGAFTRLPLTSPWLPERAERGPHSSCSPGFHVGTVLILSNQEASPKTPPRTTLTPSRLRARAKVSKDAVARSNSLR